MLRIAVLMNKFLPEEKPSGIGVVGYQLSRAISKREVDVSLFCKGTISESFDVSSRFHVVSVPHFTVSLLFDLLKKNGSLMNFDILHVHTTSTVPAMIVAKIHRMPILRQFHGSPKGIERKIDCELADRLAAVSEFSRRSIPRKFANKTGVIYNGVDPEIFKPVEQNDIRTRYHLPSYSKIILSIGMIQERKGQYLMIQIMKQLLNKYSDILYINIGRSYSLEYFQQLLSSIPHTVQGRFRFLADVPIQDLVQLINLADICVHLASSEAFGLAVVEQMSCGKPVVVFDDGAMPEIIEHMRTGLLCKSGDLPCIVNSITTLLADEKLVKDMGNNARAKVLERFTWDNSASEAISSYNELYESRN